MNLIELIAILIVLSNVSTEESETVPSLCDNPEINAADRLKNGTYRVYRGHYYWELVGLPTQIAKVNGPYRVWYEYFAPLDKKSSVQTVIGGQADGFIYKFQGNQSFVYYPYGKNVVHHYVWDGIPSGGFSAVFNDGGMYGFGYPVMVGFSAIKTYYFIARDRIFHRLGSAEGYIGGKYNESFPVDLTAAFTLPSDDLKKAKFYVYLFRRYEYCFRPINGENGCEKWRLNKELFRCNASNNSLPPTKPTEQTVPQDSSVPPEQESDQERNVSVVCYGKNTILFLISIYFLIKF